MGHSDFVRILLLAGLAIGPVVACQQASGVTSPAGAARTESCTPPIRQDARCIRVDVPEDREHPGRRTIGIRVVVFPARAATPASDAVFYLAGGPGQAASTMSGSLGDSPLRQDRDLVFMDQRGTGGSNTLDCTIYGPPADLQSYFHQFVPPARVRACRARLAATAAIEQYTTAASVEDLEAVRRALGYRAVNLVGVSYGTRLAMEYVRQFDDRVRAVVLDGPVPPSMAMPERFGELAQRSLDGVLDDCLADAACASAFPRIKEETRAVLDRLRQGPVRASVSYPRTAIRGDVSVTRDNIAEAIRYMTYSSSRAARLPLYLHEASRGNYSPLAQFLLERRAGGIFEGLYLSITCTEDLPFVSAGAAEADDPTYLGGYRVREQRDGCAEWARGRVPAWHQTPVSSMRPVLIFSGSRDPVTPPEGGDEIAKTLPNSLVVRVPGGGHSPDGLAGVECLYRAEEKFLATADLRAVDTSCVKGIARRGFATTLPAR